MNQNDQDQPLADMVEQALRLALSKVNHPDFGRLNQRRQNDAWTAVEKAASKLLQIQGGLSIPNQTLAEPVSEEELWNRIIAFLAEVDWEYKQQLPGDGGMGDQLEAIRNKKWPKYDGNYPVRKQ